MNEVEGIGGVFGLHRVDHYIQVVDVVAIAANVGKRELGDHPALDEIGKNVLAKRGVVEAQVFSGGACGDETAGAHWTPPRHSG